MRTSLKKLRGFGIHKHADGKIRRLQPAAQQLDELARAAQDMQDMRDCYDSLLSAAAATANSAYEFSESLKELGACLLEKTALNDDEESGKVLLMLGKVQFELQRLVDRYRSHIFQTITSPSESLLNELRIVEEMKRLCDEKRTVYEHMMTTHREKGRVRNRKESFSIQELQTAYDEYDEEATLFVFRLKSLKQGQSRSLLTQAARHHAAQLCFFKKALRSLDTVEPNVKLVTEQQHIDYQFMGLDDEDDGNDGYTDDGIDDENGSGESSSEISDGELSFDYAPNLKGQNIVSTRRDSMELDRAEVTFPQVATVDEAKENVDQPGQDSFAFGRDTKTSSQSAPLFAEKKFDPAERVRQMRQLSSRKFHSYVLPTPGESKNPVSMKAEPQVFQTRRASLSGAPINYRHSSPLEQRKHEKVAEEEKLSAPMRLSQPPALREGNNTIKSMGFPPPLAEELSSQQQDAPTTDSKKIKRQALSGPLTGKSWPNKRGLSASSPIDPLGPPKLFSGPLLRTPVPHRSSPPKLSPSASPTFASSPRISELHELPRPPPSNFVASYSNQIGYSGPLVSNRQEISAANRLMPRSASPLPPPPLTVTRSFSIPTRGQKATVSPMSMPLGVPLNSKITEDMISPPLTPISFSNIQPASPAS